MYELIAKSNIGEVKSNGMPNRKVKVGKPFEDGLIKSQPEVKIEAKVQEPVPTTSIEKPAVDNYNTVSLEEFKPDVIISKTPQEPSPLENPTPISDTDIPSEIKIPDTLNNIPTFEPVTPALDSNAFTFPKVPTPSIDDQPDLGDTMVLPPIMGDKEPSDNNVVKFNDFYNPVSENRTFDIPNLSGDTDIQKYVLKVEELLREYKIELENTYNRNLSELKDRYESQIRNLANENERLAAERKAANDRANSLEESIRTIVGINGRPTYNEEYGGKNRNVA